MKLWDIVKKVGSGIIREAVPGGGLIVGAINEFLPDGEKIPKNATGRDVETVLNELPPEVRSRIMEKEFDVDIEQIKQSNETLRTMLEADAKSTHTTRPYIAKHAFHVVAFSVIVCVSLWAYAVFIKDDLLVKSVMDGWQFVLAVIGPFVYLLWAYFGILRRERKDGMDAAGGNSTSSGLSDILGSLFRSK